MLIRDAQASDLDGMVAIYNDAVERTTAIWNDGPVSVADCGEFLAARARLGYPVLVAVDDHASVLGQASFGDWRAWDGYRHTVEHSVYVRRDRQGAGIGTALMRVLIERARALRKHVMVAGIEARNTASMRMHESLGFATVGHMPEVGTKFGCWLDLVFMQLRLDDRTEPDGVDQAASPARSTTSKRGD